jgi:hypothetical protein
MPYDDLLGRLDTATVRVTRLAADDLDRKSVV